MIRLKFFLTELWSQLILCMLHFKEAKLTNLEVSIWDHCRLLLELLNVAPFNQVKRFLFEKAWLRNPMYQQLVEEAWTNDQTHFFLYQAG